MKAIILAAGVGQRMETATDGRPKCLLELGGTTLLARHLSLLHGHGVRDVSVVTGFRSELVESELRQAGGGTAIHNPDYRSGSIVSLWHARHVLSAGNDVLLMDADVLYHPSVLAGLINGPTRSCFLIDRDFEAGEEPVKLCLRGGRIVEFRKKIPRGLEFDTQGESVGFFRFAPGHARRLAELTERYIAGQRRNEPCEEAIRDMVLAAPEGFGVEDVTGLPWIELDFPVDLDRARSEILPRIRELQN